MCVCQVYSILFKNTLILATILYFVSQLAITAEIMSDERITTLKEDTEIVQSSTTGNQI